LQLQAGGRVTLTKGTGEGPRSVGTLNEENAMASPAKSDRAMDRYVLEIKRYPVLTRQQEIDLAKRHILDAELDAAHQLVVSNLRFVVKISHEYSGYGLKLLDLVQEGNIGLMMAVKRFDPEKGFRLISYAVWWIRAYIQNFVMRSWSLVKLGTTQAQRKLFFKLRSERERADREADGGAPATSDQLAQRLSVDERDIIDMGVRLGSRDFSLDVELRDGARQTLMDRLAAPNADPEDAYAGHEERTILRGSVEEAMEHLNEKERYIVENRLLAEDPQSLRQVGCHFGISRERARQIEGNVTRKIRTAVVGGGLERVAVRAGCGSSPSH
jgi:RNA polymerase sigma-32 factor